MVFVLKTEREADSEFVTDWKLSDHSCDAGRGDQVPGKRPSSGQDLAQERQDFKLTFHKGTGACQWNCLVAEWGLTGGVWECNNYL